MKILYIDGVGSWGGASRSLYESISNIEDPNFEKYFLIVNGTVVKHYESIATDVIISKGLTRFDNTLYSHYRGLRWLVLFREIKNIPYTLFGITKAWFKWNNKIQLIHVNELTEIIPLILAKLIFRKPVVCHVRSVTRRKRRSIRNWLLNRFVNKYVDIIIAIDKNVKNSIDFDNSKIRIIHNSFTPKILHSHDLILTERLNKISELETFKVGFIGNLLYSKGIFDLVYAIEHLTQFRKNITVVVVGANSKESSSFTNGVMNVLGLKQNVMDQVKAYILEKNLSKHFVFLGSTYDVHRVYNILDINCFPSHFNAPGRPVIEASFSKIPSIVAVTNPQDDTIIHMETGYVINSKNPIELSKAILYFLDNPNEKKRMGENAFDLAHRNFDSKKNAEQLRDIYRNLIN